MPPGDKSSYTDKQKRKAEHIEESYEERGVSEDEAERRAWATVNKEDHGGKKSGSGRGKEEDLSPSRKGGRLGGKASASRPAAQRSASARKAAKTRRASSSSRSTATSRAKSSGTKSRSKSSSSSSRKAAKSRKK
jgi:plasmid stabilization system protein ParE